MTSQKLLQDFLNGSLSLTTVCTELKKMLAQGNAMDRAKTRYCLTFVERWQQYGRREITQHELLLSLRDLILFTGRLQVPGNIWDLVSSYGKTYNLTCENDQHVNAILSFPAWFKDSSVVKQVYELVLPVGDEETSSAGDELLHSNTGYVNYKSFEQKIAVHTAINLPPGHTLLLSLPTGGGKSLITQMLGAIDDGLTLVIVPTVALAIDQTAAAKTALSPFLQDTVFCYRGAQSEQDYDQLMRVLTCKRARLLFTSPEAILKNTRLFNVLKDCATEQYLRNLVIDEAHLVPDWGTFFRPDFQILSVVLREWRELSQNQIRTYLLSATLSDDVVATLSTLYSEEDKFTELRFDALRKEPRFCYYPAKSRADQDNIVLDLVRHLPKPMIIYVLEPEEAIRVKELLREQGLTNVPIFTGKTKDEDRDRILRNWKSYKYDIIVATSAFGIGVDKQDIRTIIHKCVPENLSRFYQEVGRAGRDGLPSLSILVPYVGKTDGEGDLSKAFGLVNKRVLRVENIVTRWFSMLKSQRAHLSGDVAFLDTATPPSTFSEQEIEYAGDRNMAWNVNLLLLLHRTGYIDIEQAFYSHDTRSYFFKTKLLRLEEMRDEATFSASLEAVRAKELNSQLKGYYAMRDLVQRPRLQCWGSAFNSLFPLATRHCSGCPSHDRPVGISEGKYKLRAKPRLSLSPVPSSTLLRRYMGHYNTFIIRNLQETGYNLEDLALAASKMNEAQVGCMVLPKQLVAQINFQGLILSDDEFCFLAEYCPYLFAAGVFCVFSAEPAINDRLFQHLKFLENLGYKTVYYCHEDMYIQSLRRRIGDMVDCYVKNAQTL